MEDEAAVQQLKKLVLVALGNRVLYAFDGMEGLRLFPWNAEETGLILLDVVMPGMDGKEPTTGSSR